MSNFDYFGTPRPRAPRRPSFYFDPFYLIFILVGLIVAAGLTFVFINANHVEHMTCTVESKDRTSNNGESDARLYTTDCGVLKVGDSILSWHFNSADTYASIKAKHRYEITTRGLRVPFLSMFPNVVKATEVKR